MPTFVRKLPPAEADVAMAKEGRVLPLSASGYCLGNIVIDLARPVVPSVFARKGICLLFSSLDDCSR